MAVNLTQLLQLIAPLLSTELRSLTFQDDVFFGTQEADSVVRPPGAGEFAFGTLAPDVLPVNLFLFPTAGENLVVGTLTGRDDGDDQIFGLGGEDVIDAGANDDTIYGGSGRDVLHGRTGDDWLYGGNNGDVLFGESLIGIGTPGPDGFMLAQLAVDEEGDDHLFGGGESDLLFGFGGNDALDGGEDNDTLDGGADNDLLTGHRGFDTFIFAARNLTFGSEPPPIVGPGHDTIIDFEQDIDGIRLIGFENASGASLAFADLDTNGNGVLDNADANVAVDPTGETVINLTSFSPIDQTSILTVLGSVNPLRETDFTFA